MSYVVEVVRDVSSYSDHRAGAQHLITTSHTFARLDDAAVFARREANLTKRSVRYQWRAGDGKLAQAPWITVEPSR